MVRYTHSTKRGCTLEVQVAQEEWEIDGSLFRLTCLWFSKTNFNKTFYKGRVDKYINHSIIFLRGLRGIFKRNTKKERDFFKISSKKTGCQFCLLIQD